MSKHNVRSVGDALAYLMDCMLATVATMATKKSRFEYVYKRQIAIAQTGVDWMAEFHVQSGNTRVADVRESFGGSVADWAAQYDVKARK